MRKIKTAFIFDPLSDEGIDDEVRYAIMELDAMVGLEGDQHLPIEISYAEEAISLGMLMDNFDLMIIDYGGLSMAGASGTGTSQVMAAARYAEDHPGCLLIIWTGYTVNIYLDEVESEFGKLDNIVLRYLDSSHVYRNINGDPAAIEKIKAWFADQISDAKGDNNASL